MDIYHFLNLFFYFEILVLIFVLVFILIKRISYFFSSRNEEKRKQKLSAIVSACFLKNEKCELIEKVYTSQLLLSVLESFNHRFNGEQWDLLKEGLSKKFLLPKARGWIKKGSWLKRNFAARVFALSPLKQDESLIVSMINDDSFLVASIAATAAIKLESIPGIKKILDKMAKKQGYYHYFYADILSQGSNTVFDIVADMGTQYNHLHLVCLEVLAMQTAQAPLAFLTKDLKSKDTNLKLAALKVAIRNPQKQWLDIFCQDLEDDNEHVRELAALGLGNYHKTQSYQALKEGLNDPSSQVKLASAKSLKALGKLDLISDKALKSYVQEFE